MKTNHLNSRHQKKSEKELILSAKETFCTHLEVSHVSNNFEDSKSILIDSIFSLLKVKFPSEFYKFLLAAIFF